MSMPDNTGLTPQPAGISVDNQERGSLSDKSMWKELRHNPRALLYAVLMHLILFLALIMNLDWKTTTPSGAGQSSVIKAQVVDNAKVQAEVNKLKQAQENKAHQEEVRKNELEKAAQQAEQRRVQEEQKLSDLQQQQVEEQQNLQKLEQQRVVQQKLEADHQAKLKIQQAEAAKQAKLKQDQDAKAAQQRAVAEEKKKTAAADAKRKQDEARQKAAEDKKRQAAAAAKQQQEAERAMQQQLAAEESAMQSSARNQGIVDKYIDGIRSAVQNNWLQPPSARPGMQCTVKVNLIPGGDVAGVRIVVSSGDAAFDRSVENAVRKAAPLPLPPEPGLFDNFRELTFVFKPEN
jgi:colicin import membrane protein